MRRSGRHDFASDNHAGVHPEVMAALVAANSGHADSYGADEHTARIGELFGEHFGSAARVYPVFNGSGANVVALAATLRGHEAAIVSDCAHLAVDEAGAPERLAGVKLLTVAAPQGKLAVADLERWEGRRGDEHAVQPGLVSLTQATELGTVYSAGEIAAIAERAHSLGLIVHMDGARLANAAAGLDLPLRALSTDAGVDIVSFGGTKNGLMFGDAVVVLDPELAPQMSWTRKQYLQLGSKMRFLSAQFEALLAGDLWFRNARHANAMAQRLVAALGPMEGIEVVQPVEANAVFARVPRAATDRLLTDLPGEHPFHVWDADREIVRWMCSWDTGADDVDAFVAAIGAALE